jgi:hypothetical protein
MPDVPPFKRSVMDLYQGGVARHVWATAVGPTRGVMMAVST